MRPPWVFLAVLFTTVSTYAQVPEEQAPNGPVRVFLDCPSCDDQYMRTEITFVSYVRDRTAADVHVLVTTQGTGGGGTEYSLKFIGQGRFRDIDNSLIYAAPQASTPDERRRGLASMLKLGLVRYVSNTPVASRLTLQFDPPKAGALAAAQPDPGISGSSASAATAASRPSRPRTWRPSREAPAPTGRQRSGR